MTNTAAIAIYLSIIVITGIILGLAYHRDRDRPVIRSFLFLGALQIGWAVAATLYFSSRTVFMARILYDVRFAFIALSTLAFLLFVLRYYRLDQYVRPQIIVIAGVFPVITAILAVTSPLHDLMRTYFEVISLWPIHSTVVVRGIWYWVHAAYSYCLTSISIVIAITQHLKLPKSRRLPSVFLLSGVLVSLLCSILTVTQLLAYPFSLTPVSTGVSLAFFYIALCNCSKMDILMLARNEIFHLIDDCVFILDSDKNIMDFNQSARGWLTQLGLPMPVHSFNTLIRFLEDSGAEFQYEKEHDPGIDISVPMNHTTVIYNIREKLIIGDDGYELGMIVTCADVTHNRMLIHRLEETAEVDALTGLYNRWGLDRMVASVIKNKTAPVALIMGDVDGLKSINDTYGHHQGDLLLREIASVLKTFCPPQGQAFRVGGDEFIMLLPGYTEENAQKIVEQIYKYTESITSFPFRVSISLGITAEHSGLFSAEDLMRHADQKMYQSKNH